MKTACFLPSTHVLLCMGLTSRDCATVGPGDCRLLVEDSQVGEKEGEEIKGWSSSVAVTEFDRLGTLKRKQVYFLHSSGWEAKIGPHLAIGPYLPTPAHICSQPVHSLFIKLSLELLLPAGTLTTILSGLLTH
jgi:hypothetical protein